MPASASRNPDASRVASVSPAARPTADAMVHELAPELIAAASHTHPFTVSVSTRIIIIYVTILTFAQPRLAR